MLSPRPFTPYTTSLLHLELETAEEARAAVKMFIRDAGLEAFATDDI